MATSTSSNGIDAVGTSRSVRPRHDLADAFHSFSARLAVGEQLLVLDHRFPQAERVVDDLGPHAFVVEIAEA